MTTASPALVRALPDVDSFLRSLESHFEASRSSAGASLLAPLEDVDAFLSRLQPGPPSGAEVKRNVDPPSTDLAVLSARPGGGRRPILDPVLPFFSVLLRGASGKHGASPGAVAEARIAYGIILASFLFDTLVWTLLMSAWLWQSIELALKQRGVVEAGTFADITVLCLGALFPAVFAAFEVGFYRSDAGISSGVRVLGIHIRGAWRQGAIAAVVTSAILSLIVVIGGTIAIVAGVVAAVGVAWGLFSAYGLNGGLTLLLRVSLIGCAAYFTSIPLHIQLMNQKIRAVYLARNSLKIENRINSKLAMLGDPPGALDDLLRPDGPKDPSNNSPAAGHRPRRELEKEMLACLNECSTSLLRDIAIAEEAIGDSKWDIDCAPKLRTANQSAFHRRPGLAPPCHLKSGSVSMPKLGDKIRGPDGDFPTRAGLENKLNTDLKNRNNNLETLRERRDKCNEQLTECRKSPRYRELASLRSHLLSSQSNVSFCAADESVFCVPEPGLAELNETLAEVRAEVRKDSGWAGIQLELVAFFLATVLPLVVVMNKLTASTALVRHLQHATRLREMYEKLMDQSADPSARVQALIDYDRETEGLRDEELQWIIAAAGSGEVAAAARVLRATPLLDGKQQDSRAQTA